MLKPIIESRVMKTIEDIKNELTDKELEMLLLVIEAYEPKDVSCYTKRLTASQKGIVGSLVKKEMLYDSYADFDSIEIHSKGNWFPTEEVLEAFGLPEHWPY